MLLNRGFDVLGWWAVAYGLQRPVSTTDESFWSGAVWPRLLPGDEALLLSQVHPRDSRSDLSRLPVPST